LRVPFLAVAAALLLSGCQGLGPATLGAGRGAYNDVIARTDSEQTLGLIVRLRYSDPIGLLAVSSVTANLRFSAQAAGEAGIGADSNFAGNLVPFSAGVAYEDNPTISYTPVDGQAFLRQWLKPIPLETLVPVMQAGENLEALLKLMVDRMNGLPSGGDAARDDRAAFARAVKLLGQLRGLGLVTWIPPSGRGGRWEMIVSGYAPAHTAEVEELLRLLGIAGDTRKGAAISIPMELGVRVGAFAGLAVQTRSIAEIMRAAADAIEVPEDHVKTGVVAPTSAPAADGLQLRIHSSRKAPSRPNVALKHRGFWYYVDDTDLVSKRTFQNIQTLFLAGLSEATRNQQKAPVLTIPVK